MSNERLVRLRRLPKGAATYSVHGIIFEVGRWARVPGVIDLGNGKTFPLAQYLDSLKADDGLQKRFDVTDEAGARKLEAEELEAEERLRSAESAPGYRSIVERAVTPANATPYVPGAETFTAEELAEAREIVRLKKEAAAKAAGKPAREAVEGAEASDSDANAPAQDDPVGKRRLARSARAAQQAENKG